MSDVELRGLEAGYGAAPVLRGVDLTVPSGTIAAVLGPSGSGKSTLLRVLAGLHRASAGQVRLGDVVVDDVRSVVPPERRGVGLVPQAGALFPHLDVRRNVAYGLTSTGRGRARGRDDVGARVAELLELTGLGDLADRMPHQLSGGQRQRVALARALAPAPALVLLDEPFSALDASLRTSLRAEVHRILRETGATALLVTHDQDEALGFADLLAVMDAGRFEQVAPPAVAYAEPATRWVATFLGDATLLPGERRGDRVRCALGDLTVSGDAPDGAVEVLLRPEQVALGAPADPGHTGVVVGRDFHGHDALLEVDVTPPVAPGAAPIRLRARVLGPLAPALGDRVAVGLPAVVRALPAV
ncbi:ABC transporter ATP-binding protein [Nocardioides sp.]|uniref:ABC transporter ATP-binding protein n=1 Tax=Nocardioides sp. TaxID=35761 RepID=UPI0035155BC4